MVSPRRRPAREPALPGQARSRVYCEPSPGEVHRQPSQSHLVRVDQPAAAAATATAYGTRMRGRGGPRDRQPRRTAPRAGGRRLRAGSARPGTPRSSASAWPRATSRTSTTLSPVVATKPRIVPRATPAIMRPVGVGLRSPSPTGVVGLTTTAPASSASRSAASFVRLYGTSSSHSGGSSSSVAGRPRPGPHVPAVLAWTMRRTPARGRVEQVPRALDVDPLDPGGRRRSCRARRRERPPRTPSTARASPARSRRSTRSSRTSAPRSGAPGRRGPPRSPSRRSRRSSRAAARGGGGRARRPARPFGIGGS